MKAILNQKKRGNIRGHHKRYNASVCIDYIFGFIVYVALLLFVVLSYSTCSAGATYDNMEIRYSAPRMVTGNVGTEIPIQEYLDESEKIIPVMSLTEDYPIEDSNLVRKSLPSDYYTNIDFSSFQPFMSYRKITDKTSPSYVITHSEDAYTDIYGFRRYKVQESQFSVNGLDDYMVALGTYYKEPGTVGSRFLIVTSTGMFTVITGSEKADKDTDPMNMYSTHCNGKCAGMIEWIVDERSLHSDIKGAGTVTEGPVEAMQGEILAIYEIK